MINWQIIKETWAQKRLCTGLTFSVCDFYQWYQFNGRFHLYANINTQNSHDESIATITASVCQIKTTRTTFSVKQPRQYIAFLSIILSPMPPSQNRTAVVELTMVKINISAFITQFIWKFTPRCGWNSQYFNFNLQFTENLHQIVVKT